MSAVAKDIGYDIAKKPILIAGTIASVVLVGYGIYYFFPDTAIGQLFGLGFDAVGYAVEGVTWWVENVTIPIFENVTKPAFEWLTDPDSYTEDIGGFFKDDVGGVFTGAGESIENAFKF